MKYLVELVFGLGFFGLAAIALFFFLRFLLLTWAVRIIGNVVHAIAGVVKTIIHALIFVFGPAVLGGFIIGLGLQIAMNLKAGDGASADPTMPALIAFLGFFVIVSIRGWQWRARRHRQNALGEVAATVHAVEEPELANYPAGYEAVAEAWSRAIRLAPERRDDLLDARATCGALLAAVELHDGLPDSAMIETANLIRNHVAALVHSTERRLRSARNVERGAMIEEMVIFLLGFAQRAQQDMQASNLAADEADAALRAHLAARLFGE